MREYFDTPALVFACGLSILGRLNNFRRMAKAVLKQVDNEIKQRREQVTQLHTELEDLEDYLDVL